MNRILHLVTFAVGAAAGSVATYNLVKKKFEKQYNEEIRVVKDELKSKYLTPCQHDVGVKSVDPESQPVEEADKPAEEMVEEDPLKEATAIVKQYISSDTEKPEKKTKGRTAKKEPYIIKPEELGDIDGYKIVCLTYFADGILAYDDGTRVNDNYKLVGRQTLLKFGEYEDSVIHARNDEIKTDFEIYEDDRDYWDIY